MPRGRPLPRGSALLLLALAFLVAGGRARALTMADLLEDSKMTPGRFAGYFVDFEFELHPFDVQDPEEFLSTRRGDCIDYAVMADHVLKRDGYKTRLIRVEMVGLNMGHAVCYVTDDSVYMDYNNRKYFRKLVRSGASIREIASKVADSFDANWTFAQEFTFSGYSTYIKRAILTVVKTDPEATDPDRAPSRANPNS